MRRYLLILLMLIFGKCFPQAVVINELMVDPEPVVGLPPYEYIELFNKESHAVDITGWTITVGKYKRSISSCSIDAKGYVILTSTKAVSELSKYGNTSGVTSFPALTNTVNTLVLSDSAGNVKSVISYTDDWYKDSNKKNGGWSIEQIDPENICGGINNWTASVAPDGGTPGKVNSVNAVNPDYSEPYVVRAVIIDSSSLQVYFNEPIDTNSLYFDCFKIQNGDIDVSNVYYSETDLTYVVIDISSVFEHNKLYDLTVSGNITDCSGNVIKDCNVTFAYPDSVIAGDLIINEILTNPKDNGVDYVEIFNRSDKILDLNKVSISTIDTVSNKLTSVHKIYQSSFLIFPKEYYLLSAAPDIIKSGYRILNPNAFIKMDGMPALNISSGIVAISDNSLNIIDKFAYTESMHYALLTSTKGVSLERINPWRETQSADNWHSASETSGYGTPGYLNSQYIENLSDNIDRYTITPEIFSPDNDGYNDLLNIYYNFDSPGYTLNIKIFNSDGQLIRNLVKNALLGRDGVFTWDGLDNNNNKAPIGIYIITFEAFNLKGKVENSKKVCVLGGKI
ncbi:MAG: lamin tail domain-containing protein [Bacteroidota bacterium]|nr:lamin tail domain-containing protein [Bacteroidota bacterium]